MIDLNADHVGFVIASYAIAVVVLLGLVVRAVFRARSLARALAARGLADPGTRSDTP